MQTFRKIIRQLITGPIWAYRYFISPFLGSNCRYYPTCSAYALESVEKHGSIKGGWMAIKRITRCHPWHEGGVDPVPEKLNTENKIK